MALYPPSWDTWDAETKKLFRAIHRYCRSCQKYIGGKPSPEVAERKLKKRYDELILGLRTPSIQDRLKAVIDAGISDEVPHLITPSELVLEMRLAKVFGLKSKEITRIVVANAREDVRQDVVTPDDLILRIADFHQNLLREAEKARDIKPRIEKKKRKRDIVGGVISITFAGGVAVANGYQSDSFPPAQASYALSLTLLHAGIRELVGQPA